MPERRSVRAPVDVWRAARHLLDKVDVAAHVNEPEDMTTIALLEHASITVDPLECTVSLTWRRVQHSKTATVVLHLDPDALVADFEAGWRKPPTEGAPEGWTSEVFFALWEIVEHSIWWDDPNETSFEVTPYG